MKHHVVSLLVSVALGLTAVLGFGACHEIDGYENDVKGNFEQLWKIMDEALLLF